MLDAAWGTAGHGKGSAIHGKTVAEPRVRQPQAGDLSVAIYLVGSIIHKSNQIRRFLSQGLWEHDGASEFLERVRDIRPGDRIVIKASYVRKRGLPFDNHGRGVSVMAIKATGTVTQNPGDGCRVQVEWDPVGPEREWYFYTSRGTIWRLREDDWAARDLAAFIFEGKEQDIGRFLQVPYWRARYLPDSAGDPRFPWIPFFQEFAVRLLEYKDRRKELVAGLKVLAKDLSQLQHLGRDRRANGTTGFVRDICPFTVMGIINRGIRTSKRHEVAQALGGLLGVRTRVPGTWDGIPVLHNMMSKFFPWEAEREAGHIDALWQVFEAALTYADSRDDTSRESFATAFDTAMALPNVGWILTFALYWSRPFVFPPLDNNTRTLLEQRFGLAVGTSGPQRRCSAQDYLELMDELELRMQQEDSPFHSLPELSMAAWEQRERGEADDGEEEGANEEGTTASAASVGRPYTLSQLMDEGVFLAPGVVEQLLERLKQKKNLILQGAPGTGKTWLARRLGWLLAGVRDEERVRAVQFHPNLSYEDFVRGYRPAPDGSLRSQDGVFLEVVRQAREDPAAPHVLVIEEINRGNPAQVFGELLTLLEADKRKPEDALRLGYPDEDGLPTQLWLPDNLFLIGTMNIADRSLALVDFALRRRFAFVTLEPCLDDRWLRWVVDRRGMDAALAREIGRRLDRLNEDISRDSRLGPAFRVGHSFVTPSRSLTPATTWAWYEQVVRTEIQPQLEEYWFDAPEACRRAVDALLENTDR
jgi:5-methylcytosine-specific restriction protein B